MLKTLSILCLVMLLSMATADSQQALLNPDFSLGQEGWKSWNGGFQLDEQHKHSGNASLCIDFSDPVRAGKGFGAHQTVTLNQSEPAPVTVGIWGKTENVRRLLEQRGDQGSWCRVSISAVDSQGRKIFNRDARRQDMHLYFEGDFDWTYVERSFVFAAPISTLTVFVQGKNCLGKAWFDSLYVASRGTATSRAEAPATPPCSLRQENGQWQLENHFLRVVIDPRQGGRILSLLDKTTATELAATGDPAGLARDGLLGTPADSMSQTTYLLEKQLSGDDTVALTLRGTSPNAEFFHLLKTFSLSRHSNILEIRYALNHAAEAMAPARYAFAAYHAIPPLREPPIACLPAKTGTLILPDASPDTDTFRNLPRGWLAIPGNAQRSGLLFTAEADALNALNLKTGSGHQAEWLFRPIRIEAGENWQTTATLMPLPGLQRVDGAAPGLAAEFAGVPDRRPDPGAFPFTLDLVSGQPQEAEIVLQAVALPDRQTVTLTRRKVTLKTGERTQIAANWPEGWHGPGLLIGTVYDASAQVRLEVRAAVGNLDGTGIPVYEPETPPQANRPDQPKAVSLTGSVVSPHIPWAKPLPHGPLKVLALMDSFSARELVELEQRIDLDCTPVMFCQGFALPDYYMDYTEADSNALLREKLRLEYDILLVGGIAWKRLTADNRQAILKRLGQGLPLLYVYPNNLDQEMAAILPLVPPTENRNSVSGPWTLASPHYITQGIPFDRLPPVSGFRYHADNPLLTCGKTPLAAVHDSDSGKGRVAALGYAVGFPGRRTGQDYWTGGGLTPTPDAWAAEDKTPPYPMHEYYYALLCRAMLWTAGREPGVQINPVNTADAQPEVTFTGTAGGLPLQLEWRLLNQAGRPLGQGTIPCTTASSLRLPLPDFHGQTFLHLRLLQQNQSIDFAAVGLNRPNPLNLTEITADISETAGQAELTGVLRVTGIGTGSAQATLLAIDALDRITARQTLSLQPGDTPFRLPLGHPLSRAIRLEAALSLNGKDAGGWQQWFYRPAQRARYDDYAVNIWMLDSAFIHSPAYLNDLRYQNISQTGIFNSVTLHNTNWRNIPAHIPQAAEFLWRHNLEIAVNNLAPQHIGQSVFQNNRTQYQETGDARFLWRQPCLHDPEAIAADHARIAQFMAVCQRFKPVHYCLGDENSLTLWGQPFDFCFSPHTLNALRQWLRQKYRQIEQLNAAYQTAYTDFTEVVPLTGSQAVASDNPASWMDHRTFMEESLANYYREIRTSIQTADPGSLVSLSGTLPTPTPHSGYDWHLLMQVFGNDVIAPYGGIQTALIRSFAGNNLMAMPYNGGYTKTGTPLFHSVWTSAFDYKGAGNSFFIDNIALNPDLTPSRQLRDYQTATTELRAGIGKLLQQTEREDDGILILYSQNAMKLAWLRQQSETFHQTLEGWKQLLEAAGGQFRFSAARQLPELATHPPALLILPYTLCLDQEEQDMIAAFVHAGGTVITDLLCGTHDNQGRPRPGDPMAALLGVSRTSPRPRPGPLSLDDIPLRLTLQDDAVAATAATTLATIDGIPALLQRQHGAGRFIICNFLPDQYPILKASADDDQNYRKLLVFILRQGNIPPPPIFIETNQPDTPRTVKLYRFRSGTARYLGVVRDLQAGGGDKHPLRLRLDRSYHLGDVRQRRALGHGDVLEYDLPAGEAALFALLPERPAPLQASLSATRIAAGSEISCQISGGSLGASAGQGERLLRLDVLAPDGTLRRHYGANLLSAAGTWNHTFSTALSDPPGTWHFRLADLAAGSEITLPWTLTAPDLPTPPAAIKTE